jgi:NAD/NADP transhydrogenase alpha subunit
MGHDVLIKCGGGEAARYGDKEYLRDGASLALRQEVYQRCNLLPEVTCPPPQANRCNHSVEIASTADDFVIAIAMTIGSAAVDRPLRSAAMAVETWPEKVANIGESLTGIAGSACRE